MFKTALFIAIGLPLAGTLTAQSFPSAEGHRLTVTVGASFSTFNPDYGCPTNTPFSCRNTQLLGIAPFADADHILFDRLGFEGEMRFLPWRGPGGMTQSSYLAGPRVRLWRYKPLTFTGKFLIGTAHMELASSAVGTGTYFAYGIGAGVDYRLRPRLGVRLDYEYQVWPSFPSNGLTPNGLSLGLTYAIRK